MNDSPVADPATSTGQETRNQRMSNPQLSGAGGYQHQTLPFMLREAWHQAMMP